MAPTGLEPETRALAIRLRLRLHGVARLEFLESTITHFPENARVKSPSGSATISTAEISDCNARRNSENRMLQRDAEIVKTINVTFTDKVASASKAHSL
ncbi:hypothetical protein CDAR_562311 [Caerostris darwini]|uniref:Uncharacterized protein n=1 Tax=Caerostris darwini TaxID=1538125 RepID=A0AAV4X777_9ARAC|nr:hypothetical protein CDAR_562311 [Caerostris darwini]